VIYNSSNGNVAIDYGKGAKQDPAEKNVLICAL